jgi:hypothetical protein
VTREWWESTTPRPDPAGGFVAVRKIIRDKLRNGWTDEQVLRALRHVSVVTKASLEAQLRRRQNMDRAREEYEAEEAAREPDEGASYADERIRRHREAAARNAE